MLAFLTFLGSPLGKLCGYAALAGVLALTILGVKHEWDLGQAARHTLAQAQHVAHAQQVAVTKVDRAAAAAEPKAQTRIVTRYRTLTKEVPTYVPTSVPCIPWGVVRLHDAAVLGVDPASLQPPAAGADDACSDVDPRAFVGTVLGNYQAAEQNAEQLNALEKNLRDRADATKPAQ